MPHPRNDDFVGRKKLLRQLRRALRPGADTARAVALVQAIHGLGGVGKTQLAIRYVHEHAKGYDAVLWVTADPPTRLATDYADLARPLGLWEATGTTDVNKQIAAVRRWLESHESGRWLLVFDNAECADALRAYLPTRHAGHVLITSRRPRWERPARAIEVQTMERRESVQLLLRRSGQSDAVAAGALAEALGDLPLALAQAAGYLADSGLSIAAYVDLFRQRRAELLQRGDPSDTSRLTVFATFDLALQQINRPEVEDLIGLIACLAPDDIPRQLLEAGLGDPLRLADALAALGRHSLIQAGPQVVEVHRLVQAVAWDRMPPDAQEWQAERAVKLLGRAFPSQSQDVRTWDECKALQPHADQVIRLAEQCPVVLEMVGELLDRVGVFDECRALWSDAERRYRRALAIKERTLGPDDPRVAVNLGNLGRARRSLGDLSGARALQERALRLKEAAYGPEHPEVARTLGNLGNVAHQQGDLVGARALQERALRLKEAAYGPEHPEVARTLGNLGVVAHDQGDLSGARALLERALRIEEAAYGPEHSEVASTLTNLGYVLAQTGAAVKAAQLAARALNIFQRSLGEDHPNTTQARKLLQQIEGTVRGSLLPQEPPGGGGTTNPSPRTGLKPG